MIKQVSKYNDVDVVTFQKDIINQLKNNGHAIPKTTKFLTATDNAEKPFTGINKIWTWIKYRLYFRTLQSTDISLFGLIPLLNSIQNNSYDCIIFEHVESLRLWMKLKSFFPKALIILDAHNVDHILLKDTKDKERLKRIKKTESTLYKNCDLVFAASDKDAEVFKGINKKQLNVITVPNGVDTKLNVWQLPDFDRMQKTLIFCGSLDYEPNQAGLLWFINNLWESVIKKHPDIVLRIVGKGKTARSLENLIRSTSNIELIGEVKNVIPFYRESQCAIVPLLHGSGTRLKILEAMSLGVPVISSSIGAEGINYSDTVNIFICNNPDEYLYRIDQLYKEAAKFKLVSENAGEFVRRNYCWNEIGKCLNKNLKKVIKERKSVSF